MICACNKSRVQIQAVKPKVFDIVKVLTDTVYGSAIIRDRRETVIRIRFSCFADLPFSICETVRKDIINYYVEMVYLKKQKRLLMKPLRPMNGLLRGRILTGMK